MKEFAKPSILTVVEHYGGMVQGPDRGGWRKAKCPIHDDGTASASVNEDACRFRCHVCDFSGDAVDLIKEIENVGLADAARLAEGFLEPGERSVREERGRSGLLPGGKGHRPGRRAWSAPWARF